MQKRTKILSIITALTMCLSLLPVQVFAKQDDGVDHDNYVVKVNGTDVEEYVEGQASDDNVRYQVDEDGNMLLALSNLSLEADNDYIEGIGNAALYVKGENKLTVYLMGTNSIYEKAEPSQESFSAAIYLDGFTEVEFYGLLNSGTLTATAAGGSNTHSYGLYCRAPGGETMTVNIYSLGAVTFRSSPVDETAGEGQYHAGAFLTNANGQSGALSMKLGSLSLYGGTEAANVSPELSKDAEGMLLNLDSPNGRTLTATVKDDRLPIYVGGTRVTNANAGNVLGDGTVSYDDKTCTLTLNSATIDTAYAPNGSDMPAAYGVYFNDYLRTTNVEEPRTLTIELVGENRIVVPNITEPQAFYGYGISAYGGIRIVGSGSLTVAAAASARMCSFTGIDAELGSLIVGNEGLKPSISIDLKDATIALAPGMIGSGSNGLSFQGIEASGAVDIESGRIGVDFKGLTVSDGADTPRENTIMIIGMECDSVSVDADAELSVSMWDKTKGLVRSSDNLKDVNIKGLDVGNWDDKNPVVNLLGATNILLGGVSLAEDAKAEEQRIIGIDASTAILCGEQVDIRVNAEKSEAEDAYVYAAVSTADTITRASEDVFVALLTGTPGESGTRGVSLANFKPRVDSISNYLVIYAQKASNLQKESAPVGVVFTATGLDKGELSNIGEGDLYYSVDGGSAWQLVTMKQSADTFEVTGVNATNGLKLYRGGNYYTTLDSDIVSIDDVTQADKPVIGTVTQPTAAGESGTVADVTAAMEYSADGGMTWTACDGDSVELSAGLYQFRVKAAGHMLASSSASVEIVAYGASPAATPEAVFDADGMDSGVLSKVASGMSYSLDGGETWTAITGTSAVIERGVSANMDILVRNNGNGQTTCASETQRIDIVAQAAPSDDVVKGVSPTVLANDNGRITGVTTDMQIWWDDAWQDCKGTEVTGLWPDVYSLRYKPNGTKLASDVLIIELDDFEGTQAETPHVTFVADGSDSGYLCGVTTQMTYSIGWGEYVDITDVDSNGRYHVTGIGDAQELIIYDKGNGVTTRPSDGQSIELKKAKTPRLTATQPTEEVRSGSINTSAEHQISTDGVTWKDCNGVSSGLAAGVYFVRVAPNAAVLASEAQRIVIEAYVHVHDFSVKAYDSNAHWTACSRCGAADPTSPREAHTMTAWAETAVGVSTRGCEHCDYAESKVEVTAENVGSMVNDAAITINGSKTATGAAKDSSSVTLSAESIEVIKNAADTNAQVKGVAVVTHTATVVYDTTALSAIADAVQAAKDAAPGSTVSVAIAVTETDEGNYSAVSAQKDVIAEANADSSVFEVVLDVVTTDSGGSATAEKLSDFGSGANITVEVNYTMPNQWVAEMLKVYRVETSGALTLMDNINVNSGKLSWSTGSHSLYMVAQEYTVTFDAATNGGACATASAVTTNDRLTSLPSASKASDASYNYSFTGWFTAPVGGEAVTASTNYTADTTIYAQFASSTRGSSTSRSSGSSTSTASVSGSTVTPKTSISGTIATVGTISDADLNKAGASGVSSDTVVIDVRDGRKTVDEARLSSGLLSRIEKLTTADGLTLGLSTGDVSFNDDALSAIAAAGSGTVSVSLKTGDTKLLTSAQERSVSDLDVVTVLSVNLTVGGKAVTSFGDGEVTIAIPFTPRAGTDIGDYRVAYIDDEGRWSVIDSSGANGRLSFRTNHFSDYVVLYRPAESVDNPFFDVPTDAWYYDTVLYAYRNGLMNGVSNHMFNPESIMTRGMLATILWRMDGSPDAAYTALFSDVADGAWYTKAILWAASNGIVMGDNGKFAPDDAVTREQFAAMLYRYATYKGMDVSVGEDTNILSYGDASSVSEYAISAMQWVCGAGIVNGYTEHGEQVLGPQRASTRAVAATMLMRFCTGNR